MNIPEEWADLPGEFTVDTGESYYGDTVGIRVTQRVPATHGFAAKKTAAVVAVTKEMIADTAVDLRGLIAASMDRYFRPWAYPDRPASWTFDPFPRWTRLCAFARRMKARVSR